MNEPTIAQIIPRDSPVVRTLREGSLAQCQRLFRTWAEDEKIGEYLQGNWGPTKALVLFRAMYVGVIALAGDRPKIRDLFWETVSPAVRLDVRSATASVKELYAEVDEFRKQFGLPAFPIAECCECGTESRVFELRRDMCWDCITKYKVQLTDEEYEWDTFSQKDLTWWRKENPDAE